MKKYVIILLTCIFGSLPAYGEAPEYFETVYHTKKSALKKCFPSAQTITKTTISLDAKAQQEIESQLGQKINRKSITYYVGKDKSGTLGYAMILDELGKHYPMTFIVSISQNITVKNVLLMIYRERIGADVRRWRFMKQFIKKKPSDPLVVDQDINGISGATISSWSISSGVKKALIITKLLQSKL